MAVNLIPEAGETVLILAEHSAEIQRRTVGVDKPVPDNLNAILPISQVGVVLSDRARALRNQDVTAPLL